jgi:hypothetical protein
MRGDQLARQRRVSRAIEARPDKLTIAENVKPDGENDGLTDGNPFESLFQKLEWAFLF